MGSRRCNRRDFLKLAGVGTAGAVLGGALPRGTVGQNTRKTNIVLILADDLGYGSVGCYGFRDAATPHIDSIASDGVRCTSAYVTCPICSPTRAGMITGRYQQRFGHEDNPGPPPVASANFGLPEGQKTLGDYLKAEGYATAVIGKWHLGHRDGCHPLRRGFDEFYGFLTGAHSYVETLAGTDNPLYRGTTELTREEYLTDALGREAVDFIGRNSDRPFFLYLPFNAVHAPLEAPERYRDSFDNLEFPKRRQFAGMLKAMDDAVGRVLAKLKAEGLDKNTLVFFLGDNGGFRLPGDSLNTPLRGFKGDIFEGGVRVPFMVRWDGVIPAGQTYDRTVLSLDIAATCMAAAGAKPASVMEGVDLTPHLAGRNNSSPHYSVFWRLVEKSGARVGDWKLVQNGDGVERLFNLAEDPAEENDLASARPDRLKEVREVYRRWDAGNTKPLWLDGRRRPDNPVTPGVGDPSGR